MVERVCVAKAITPCGVISATRSCALFEGQCYHGPRLFKIDVKKVSGESLVHLRLKPSTLAEDFETLVADLSGVQPEVMALITLAGKRIRGAVPLSAWCRSTLSVFVVLTAIPEGNDGIEICDGCGWRQYVFHGCSMSGLGVNEFPVHVISLCSSCGGQPREEDDDEGI